MFFFVILVFIGSVKSQTCCSGGIPLSNNLGLENIGKGSLQISINYDLNNLNTLNSGTKNLNDNSRKRITHSILVNTSYSITDRLSIEALLTWVNQRRIINQFSNTDLQQTNGFGDGVIIAKYEFPGLLGQLSNANIGIGTKIPFGSYDESDEIGIAYIADLQPGSGAWDLVLFTSMSKNFSFRPTTTFTGKIIYRSTGENSDYLQGLQVYEYGNEIQTFFGVSDEFLAFKTLMNPGFTFKYRNSRKDQIDGFELDNTGGEWLFIIPSISIKLSSNISFQSKAELPIFSNVDGTQLTPTYRFTGGFLINFNLRKNEINFNNIKR